MSDLCPTMTGNTAPSGTASAGYVSSLAYKALDDDAATYWYSAGSPTWWQYVFASGQVVEWYSIRRDNSYGVPTSWVLKASNNGSDWTTLDTQAAPSFSSNVFSGSFSNTTAYTYYKLDSLVGSVSNFRIYEVELWTGPHTAITPSSVTSPADVGEPYVVVGTLPPDGVTALAMPTFRPDLLSVGVGPLSGVTPALANPTLDISDMVEGLAWDATTRGGLGGCSFYLRQPTGSRSTRTSTNLCPDPLGTAATWWPHG